jgi:hypothetical protein
MPKVSLQFDCPEENEELMTALHGIDYKIILGDISQWARSAQKHGHNFKTADEVIEYVRELIIEGCLERRVDIY